MDSALNVRVATPGLDIEHFWQVCVRGLGDGQNSRANSMAWFKGRLYVGTARNFLSLTKRRGKALPAPKMECWPVVVRDPMPPEMLRAEIWSYDPAQDNIWSDDPAQDSWKRIYQSPLIEFEGRTTARDVGFRSMVIYQGRSDPEPSLYVASISGAGLRLLRSRDGEHFEEVGEPGLVHPQMVSCRSLLVWRGRLYFTPAGTRGVNPNETEFPTIFESEDPANGEWRAVCLPGFGDDTNRAIAEMEIFDDHLYASTLNPTSGLQLWKTRGEGDPPYAWTRVLSGGAYRGYLNEGAISLRAFGGALYVGTGIAGGGYNRWHNIGPAAAELLRVYSDDTWDLLVGTPRLTPAGTKLPLSTLGPGFSHPLNGYMWRMCEHEGWLYVGTYSPAVWFPFRPLRVPEKILHALKLKNVEELVERYGGCHLWRTQDGEHFTPVTVNGFGTPYNEGIRELISTPVGFFVGTSNPFGPEVGVKRNGAWTYEPNPRGGMEIWLGTRAYQGERLEVTHPRPTATTHHRQTMSQISQLLFRWVYMHLTEAFYEESGFTQMGFWKANTTSAKEACENLVEELLQQIPDKRGPILEVSCGQGATTEILRRHYPQDRIVGIDVMPVELDIAQRRLPGVRFKAMPPTRLDFDEGSFRNIICVESACYFHTRKSFLKEAYRVLELGGRLVLSDILYSKTGEAMSVDRHRENYLPHENAYERLLEHAGFKDIRIIDATEPCARAYQSRLTSYLTKRFLARAISEGDFSTLMGLISEHVLFLKRYVLVSASKF